LASCENFVGKAGRTWSLRDNLRSRRAAAFWARCKRQSDQKRVTVVESAEDEGVICMSTQRSRVQAV